MIINKIKVRRILNSKADVVWEVELDLEGKKVWASAPVGTSAGKWEVNQIPHNYEKILKEIEGKDWNQKELDDFLFKNINNLGALSLSISMAFFKGYYKREKHYPIPVANVYGGGLHGGKTLFQEFLVIPKKPDFFVCANFYKRLGEILKERDPNFHYQKNFESAWVSNLEFEKVMEILLELRDEFNVNLGWDIAASSFYRGGKYAEMDPEFYYNWLSQLVEDYEIFYVEDPFHEEDYSNWIKFNREFKNRLVVGDDLTATNPERIKSAILNEWANSFIIKPNQIGTFSKADESVRIIKEYNKTFIVSHRSGETDDVWLAYLASYWKAPYIKCGIAGERIVKINEILRNQTK